MYDFRLDIPVKVFFGCGKLKQLREIPMPGKKALIAITNDKYTKELGYLDTLEAELDASGVEHVLYENVRPNPTDVNVKEGVEIAKENGCDFVIALGGGSVIDCCKSIALMLSNTGELWDYSFSAAGGKIIPEHPAVPIVTITTSAGTGSEVDCGAVITNEISQEKSAIVHDSIYPAISIVDPELTRTVPPKLTAFQGMDAFFHAAETVISTKGHPMSEMFALKTIELVAKYLPRAVKNGSDMEAREHMLYASNFAGYYMLATSEHTMEHVMGSFHDIIHGAGLIMMARGYYGFFAERKACEGQMIKMAKAMGVEQASSSEDFMKALNQLIEDVGCSDVKMSDVGITREELKKYPAKVHEVLAGDIKADPLLLSDEDYLEIFEKAYR